MSGNQVILIVSASRPECVEEINVTSELEASGSVLDSSVIFHYGKAKSILLSI